MKDLFKALKILLFLVLMAISKEDLCPDHQINIDALGSSCVEINDLLEKEDLSFNWENLLYLATNNKGIIEKNNYILEIIKLNDDKLQSQNIKKSKLYIPATCIKSMEEDEKIKLDKSKAVVILVYNYNEMTINNLPDIYFVMRQVNEGSEVKYLNSKTFDLSLCHEDPILFDNQINITTLKYGNVDNTTNTTNTTDEINVDRIIYAKKLKVDLFDPHSQFLNDICFKFTSEKKTDVTLDSRLEDYYQNITLCNESLSAHYMEYNYSTDDKMLTFRCAYGFYESIEEKESYIDNIDSKMKFLFSTSNIKVITCFEQLFNVRELIHNYGGIICIIVIIIQIILYIVFCCKGAKSLVEKTDKVLKSENELKEEEDKKDANKDDNVVDSGNDAKTEDRLQNGNNETPLNNLDTAVGNNQNIVVITNGEGEAPREKKRKKTKKKTKIDPANPKERKSKSKTVIQNKKKGNLALINQDDDNNNDDKKDEDKKRKKKLKTTVQKKADEEKSKMTQIFKLNDEDRNELNFKRAVKFDKNRGFCKYYWSILQISHIIINVFMRCDDDYNLFSVKLGLLFMLFPINLTFNIFFFTSKNIKATYINDLNELALLAENLLHTFASSIFSSIFLILLKMLCLTHSTLRKIKKMHNKEDAKKERDRLIKCINIRINLYYILSFIFLIVFGYYIACFCVIFENTQYDLIKSMFTSWALSLLYPFLICLVTAIFRMIGVKKEKRWAYKINQILQMF